MAWHKPICIIVAAIAVATLAGLSLAVWIPWCKMGEKGCSLGVAEWAYWIAAIGTISTLAGTIWIATRESARRKEMEISMASISAAHMHVTLIHVHSVITGVESALRELKVVSQKLTGPVEAGVINFHSLGMRLKAIPTFGIQDLLPLAPLPGKCAAKIAIGQGFISACIKILTEREVEGMTPDEVKIFIDDNLNLIVQADKSIQEARLIVFKYTEPAMKS